MKEGFAPHPLPETLLSLEEIAQELRKFGKNGQHAARLIDVALSQIDKLLENRGGGKKV